METKKQQILIVDDMPINIQVLAEALKHLYKIKIATSGDKALEIAKSDDPPDLILLDIVMPEMDGLEVIRKLKGDPKTRKIPVIFITVKDEIDDEARGLELGANDYITKPFHLPIVKARIKTQLELKRKNDMLEKLVFLDALTHIPNRRGFDEFYEKEWRRACRKNSPISVIMMDIDFFKDFNDCYGHAAGDDCLRKVAKILNEILQRPGDQIARYGGEEFVAVLPGTDVDGAESMAEKIQERIKEIRIPHASSTISDHLTLSLGVATTIPEANNLMDGLDLSNAADKMLYQAKADGRNQIKQIHI